MAPTKTIRKITPRVRLSRLKRLRAALAKETTADKFDALLWLFPKKAGIAFSKFRDGLGKLTIKTLRHKSCGTVGCIAGHAVLLFGDENKKIRFCEVESEARELLGLSVETAEKLFYPGAWKGNYCNHTENERALLTIDALIATNGESL